MVWPFVMSFSFRFAVINMCRWDALLFGEHRRINPEESDLKKMLNTFHKRPPEKAYGDRKKLHEKILSYVPHMQFKFEPDCVNLGIAIQTVVLVAEFPGIDKSPMNLELPNV